MALATLDTGSELLSRTLQLLSENGFGIDVKPFVKEIYGTGSVMPAHVVAGPPKCTAHSPTGGDCNLTTFQDYATDATQLWAEITDRDGAFVGRKIVGSINKEEQERCSAAMMAGLYDKVAQRAFEIISSSVEPRSHTPPVAPKVKEPAAHASYLSIDDMLGGAFHDGKFEYYRRPFDQCLIFVNISTQQKFKIADIDLINCGSVSAQYDHILSVLAPPQKRTEANPNYGAF